VATSADGGHVTVSISHTGTGIPDDVLPMIFDPFFTTKDIGKGTGQGLVRAVVQEGHGGTLLVASEFGSGSTFTIRLPIAGEPQPDRRPLSRRVRSSSSGAAGCSSARASSCGPRSGR
jgi:two-component system NtrC family sensor kinase